MPAKDTIEPVTSRVVEGTLRYLRRQLQPPGVQAVEQPAYAFSPGIEFLQLQVEKGPEPAEEFLIDSETVELVPVDGDVPEAGISPRILLVHPHPDQVRHERRKPLIMVSFHPHDLDVALGVRQLPDLRQEPPVVFLEPGKVQVGEHIAQKNESAEGTHLQQALRLARPADIGTQVHVADDQRVGW